MPLYGAHGKLLAEKLPLRAILLGAALGVYAFFGLAWITLPGPEQDELLFLNISLPTQAVTWYSGEVEIFHHHIPIMLLPYLGALKGWIWRGVFLLWKPSIYSVRAPAVLLGGLALFLFYLWVRRFYPPAVALPALGLAATDPTYIYTIRLDLTVLLAHLFCDGGLLLGACWIQSERRHWGWLAGAGICFGLGMWDKSTFIWFLAALGATLLILFPRQVAARLRPAAGVVFLAAFLLGALPLVVYNFKERAEGNGTSSVVRLEKLDRSVLEDKLVALKTTLDGRFVYGWVGGFAMNQERDSTVSGRPQLFLNGLARLGPAHGIALPWALLGAWLVAMLASGSRRPILFPLVVSALMWVEMLPLERAGGGAHHYSLAYPLPQLAVAAAGGWLWARLGARWLVWKRGVLAAGLAVLMLTQIGWDARYLQSFRQTGGQWNWTDAIYRVADYLNANPPDLLVNMDWGFTAGLMLLTHGRVPQNDFYSRAAFADSTDLPRQLVPLLQKPKTLFLFHTEPYDDFPEPRKVFLRALAAARMRARTVQVFFHRTGEAVAELVQAEPLPAGTEANYEAPVELSFTPGSILPGEEYRLTCREFAGHPIDLKYVWKDKPKVASRFCVLDSEGNATVRVPAPFPAGTIDVFAARVSGVWEWRPASARITVR